MLTKKQYDLLMFLELRLREDGVSPSFDEMKDALGLKSKSGIHRLISGLEERGFIRRLAHRARAIEVVKLPENARPLGFGNDLRGPLPHNVIEGGFGANRRPEKVEVEEESSVPAEEESKPSDSVSLPLYGRIAAGTPIEALRDPSNVIKVPPTMLTKGKHYALQVDGDSMVEAGILDGDTVIIREADTAENGMIVVALVENEEVTLKRIRRKGAAVALEPANKAYETRIFGPDQVQVQGHLVGLLRNY